MPGGIYVMSQDVTNYNITNYKYQHYHLSIEFKLAFINILLKYNKLSLNYKAFHNMNFKIHFASEQ